MFLLAFQNSPLSESSLSLAQMLLYRRQVYTREDVRLRTISREVKTSPNDPMSGLACESSFTPQNSVCESGSRYPEGHLYRHKFVHFKMNLIERTLFIRAEKILYRGSHLLFNWIESFEQFKGDIELVVFFWIWHQTKFSFSIEIQSSVVSVLGHLSEAKQFALWENSIWPLQNWVTIRDYKK